MKKIGMVLLGLLTTMLVFSMVLAQENTSEGKTEWDDGIINFKSQDGKFQTRFDVRMYINGAVFFGDTENKLSNGTHLRKGRFAMKTKLWDVWRAEWDIDMAEGIVEVKDMFFSYRGFRNSHIKVGHFKIPQGLNELMSSRYQTFVERAYPMLAFKTGRRAAIEYSHWGRNWNVRAAVFGQKMDNVKNKQKDETGGGAAARVVFAPLYTDQMVVHTGISGVYENPDDETNAMSFKSEPETKIGDVEILDTGTIFDVDYATKLGLEGAFTYKNFAFQSEYIRTHLKRMNGQKDGTLDGGYAFVSWILTGEHRPWDSDEGEFGQIMPKNVHGGAWELAARYSHLNLYDANAGIFGGKANNYTVALNWYPNPNMKIMVNFTRVDNSEHATGDIGIGNYDFNVLHAMAVVFF